jgi:hypothetical protein
MTNSSASPPSSGGASGASGGALLAAPWKSSGRWFWIALLARIARRPRNLFFSLLCSALNTFSFRAASEAALQPGNFASALAREISRLALGNSWELKATPLQKNRRTLRENGSALVELTVCIVVLLSVGTFGFTTLASAFTTQTWAIAQTMTDAECGIETASAQRWVFSEIKTSGRWPQFPLSAITNGVVIGQTPRGPVTAQVTRTLRDLSANGTTTYALESYVLYRNASRTYCKLSRVIRSE